jgi:hypothetical protein
MTFQLPKFFSSRPPVTESEHQLVVMTYCRTHTDKRLANAFHIANGGMRSKREAAELKSIGVKAGVSDLFLPVMVGGSGGLWIEMKTPGGKLSKEQEDWLTEMNSAGYKAHVCYGWEEAVQCIDEYMGEK